MSMSTTRTSNVERIVLVGLALFLAMAAGGFAAHATMLWVACAVGTMMALALISSSLATLWFVLVTGLVVTGVLEMYLPAAKALKYVPVAAAGGLLLHVISDWLTKPRRRVPSTVAWFFVFLGFSLFSL